MVATLAFGGVILGSSFAGAQRRGRTEVAEENDEARAATLFREAVELYRAGDFDTAAALFRRAHELDPEPILLFNLARAHEAANRHLEAAETYERYLRDAPEAEDRAAIEALVANLRAREAAEQAAAQPEEPDEPAEATTEVAPVVAPTDAERTSAAPWVVLGGGVATLGAGLTLGLLASARNDDAQEAGSHELAVQRRDEADRLQLTANVLFGIGGALAVGGLVWGLVTRRRPRDVEVALGFGHVGLRVQLR